VLLVALLRSSHSPKINFEKEVAGSPCDLNAVYRCLFGYRHPEFRQNRHQ